MEIALWKGKVIEFGTPHRVEMILIFLYTTFLLWFDVLNNLLLSYGASHRVTWFGNITMSALDLAVIILILFHLSLMGLFLMSLKSKATNRAYDIIIGTIAFFGTAILLSGFMAGLYGAETIHFLFMDFNQVSYYHLGIGSQFISAIYWVITK